MFLFLFQAIREGAGICWIRLPVLPFVGWVHQIWRSTAGMDTSCDDLHEDTGESHPTAGSLL